MKTHQEESRADSLSSSFLGSRNLPYLHSEVEHQAVRMGFSQLVKQISPRGVCNHLLKPCWGLPETRARPKASLESGKCVLQKQSLQLEETPGCPQLWGSRPCYSHTVSYMAGFLGACSQFLKDLPNFSEGCRNMLSGDM